MVLAKVGTSTTSPATRIRNHVSVSLEKLTGDFGAFYPPGDLREAAQRVGELNLPRCAALRLKQSGAGDKNDARHRARRGDVQPVQAVQELHPPRGVLRR